MASVNLVRRGCFLRDNLVWTYERLSLAVQCVEVCNEFLNYMNAGIVWLSQDFL